MLTFLWSLGFENFEDARFIRQTVFIDEQGFENEFDEIDKIAYHVTAFLNGKPVAVGRLFTDKNDSYHNGIYHIGRVAVLKEYRGQHYGDALMREILIKAKSFGAQRIELGAQVQAQNFYSKLGFMPFGDEFDDEGCPHIMMRFLNK